MVNFINSWAQGIILAVIISTMIEIILPEGNSKKYIKTIIGIYMLFVIVYPIISKISNKNVNIQSVIDDTISQMNEYEINNNIIIETNSYIEETYKKKVEEDIKKKINEKGYTIDTLNLYIETENDEKYGQINSIVMQISKIENNNDKNIKENLINEIENIEVDILGNNINKSPNLKKENISYEELDSIKEYLNTAYLVEKEKIYINE